MKWNEMKWNGMKWNEWVMCCFYHSNGCMCLAYLGSRGGSQTPREGRTNSLGCKGIKHQKILGRLSHLRPTVDERNRPHQLMIVNLVFDISTGAGFPPSTVLTQKIWRFHPLKLDFSPHMYPYATGNRVPHALEITSPEQLKKGPLSWLYKWLNPDMDYCPLGVLGFFGGHGIWNSIGLYS